MPNLISRLTATTCALLQAAVTERCRMFLKSVVVSGTQYVNVSETQAARGEWSSARALARTRRI
jgi:hypothetical protein